MLYICIPVYNEAPTIGVLLWRIRATFQEHAREYELVVYDDGSTDATAEVLEPYTKALPLTVLSGRERRGYAAAVDALCRHVAAHTRYPRRDAMVLMQGDFTDRPEHLPELVKRFEGGADIVATERSWTPRDPAPARRLRRLAPWLLRPFVRIDGIADVTSGYRLIRISLLRDLLRERGDAPLVAAAGWAANAELLLALAPHARRIESVPVEPRYDVRPRSSRLRPASDAFALARFGWGARALAQRARATPRPVSAPSPRPAESPREAGLPNLADDAEAPAVPLALSDAAGAGPSSRRRKRPRREPRPDDEAAAGGPPDVPAAPSDEARPAREPGRGKRRAAVSAEASVPEAVVPDAPSPLGPPPLGEAPAAGTDETRRRRRARRTESRDAAESAAESPVSPADAPSPEPSDAADVEAGEPEGMAVDGDAPARAGRRSRRSRKRRNSTRNPDGSASADGDDPALADRPASDGGEPAPGGDWSDGESPAADSEIGVAEGPSRPARRSRRGRRRGGRSGGAGAPSAGDDAGGEPSPGAGDGNGASAAPPAESTASHEPS